MWYIEVGFSSGLLHIQYREDERTEKDRDAERFPALYASGVGICFYFAYMVVLVDELFYGMSVRGCNLGKRGSVI